VNINTPLAGKQTPDHRTVVEIIDGITCGGNELFIVAGPCAVENLQQMETVVNELPLGTIQALRGCIYKPRTSPYSFQGLAEEGIALLCHIRKASGLPIVTEVMSCEQAVAIVPYVDVLQIGSRNMQNFELLKTVGGLSKPVLLKRGLAATIEEFILAAEYIMAHGNPNVIMCERGIRSFDSFTRNVLDLGAVVALRQITHLPVIVDPSHAAGKRELVADLARAAVACGADGLIIECHPQPEMSVSDARQALSLPDMRKLIDSLESIVCAIDRKLIKVSNYADLDKNSPDRINLSRVSIDHANRSGKEDGNCVNSSMVGAVVP
jgi:3-deoxy-7-phosphoheptulonate synthase